MNESEGFELVGKHVHFLYVSGVPLQYYWSESMYITEFWHGGLIIYNLKIEEKQQKHLHKWHVQFYLDLNKTTIDM